MGWFDRLRTEGLCVQHEVHEVQLDAEGSVGGTSVVEGQAVGAGRVVFALPTALSVTDIHIDGAAAGVEVDIDGVCAVAAPRTAQGEHRLEVAYAGRLPRAFMRDACGQAWYELQSMTGWHPRFASGGLSTSRVVLTAPATFGAVSSFGLVQEGRTPSGVRYVWDTAGTLCEDFALVVGEGLHGDGAAGAVGLRALCPRTSPYHPDRVVGAAAAAVQAYSRWWGPCPYPRVTIACLPHASCGNCSRAGLALLGELHRDPASDYGAFGLLAHELCHMWWGLGVGFDEAAGLGYLEALAHYGDERLLRERHGAGAFRDHLAGDLLPNARAAEAAAGVCLRDCRYNTPESSRLRQSKGAAVMLLLERRMGRTAMDVALSNLLRAFRGRIATPADVRQAFVDVGGAPTARFFDDYFDGVAPIPGDPEMYGE